MLHYYNSKLIEIIYCNKSKTTYRISNQLIRFGKLSKYEDGKISTNEVAYSTQGSSSRSKFYWYEIQVVKNLATNQIEEHHVTDLRPFYHDPLAVDPRLIAYRDQEVTAIDRIIRHAGDCKKKTEMDFLVRWEGLDESKDLWLPWKELRNNSKLHEYLQQNNMARLIPKSHSSSQRIYLTRKAQLLNITRIWCTTHDT